MAAPATAAVRERVSFDANTPVDVTIESSGIEQASRDGSPEYRYKLEGNRIMWVSPEAHQQIVRAMQQQPDANSFTLTKRKRGREAATWEVVQHADAWPGYDQPPAPRPAPVSQPRPAVQPARSADLRTQQRPLPEASGEPYSTTLYTCLCAAMRDAQAAEAFAQQIGRPIAFETADVRAMAATLFIHATGGR